MKRHHWISLIALLSGTLILDRLGPAPAHPHAWDALPLFYAAYGFLGCVLIIGISKALGKTWLQRREDYYDRDA
jgi:hypothetical protein